ncbi:MAG: S-layer homology domain-containing protein [Clostridia bacterium]|nr:S-layer homology domain-containing protein [Clostridia bacterium]
MKKKVLCLIAAIALAITMLPAAGLAADVAEIKLESAAAAFDEDALPEWAIDTGEDEKETAELSGALPSRFCLIDEGVVTPAKQQSPFGTCVSFAVTAAAETSILSAAGKTYEEMPLDLSEKHLAWFTGHPITELTDPAQAGEGIHCFNEENDPNAVFNVAGRIRWAEAVFSSGAGPAEEELFPYRGSEGITEYEYMRDNHDEWIENEKNRYLTAYNMTLPELLKAFDITEEYLYEYLEWSYADELEKLESGERADFYSAADDWSIPETDSLGRSNRSLTAGYTLTDCNFLSPVALLDENGAWAGLSEEGMTAAKKELLCGRGLAVAFCGTMPNPGVTDDERYMNKDTWAHYTFDGSPSSHAVCIVGWDDTYSRDNFNGGVDEETGLCRTPPGDGAWIVKNSWGRSGGCGESESGRAIGKNDWGIDGSGCFYLSYYDTSLKEPLESMVFAKSPTDKEVFTYQYDYIPTSYPLLYTSNDVHGTANVFTAEDDVKLVSAGFSTYFGNMRVTVAVYRLDDGALTPTEGTLLERTSRWFEYAGYHRIDLETEPELDRGDRFSVVVTAYSMTEDGSREYSAYIRGGVGKEKAAQLGYASYYVSVVNPGESFRYDEGEWFDWGEHMKSEIFAAELVSINREGCVFDNFPIKAFAVPREKFEYTCTRGSGSVWRMKSNTGPSFTFARSQNSDTLPEHFTGAAVDGAALADGDFTMSESGVLTIAPEYLDTLSEGAHTLSARFDDGGPAEASFTVTSASSGGGGGGGGGGSSASQSAKNEVAAAVSENGSVSFSANSAKSGEKVTVTVTPKEGFKTAGVTVTDANGKAVAVTANADGTYTFTMPATKVTVTPEFVSADDYMLDGDGMMKTVFVDTDESSYYYTPVMWAVANGITTGTDETHFSPDAACTRAQVVTFLYRAAGSPEAGETDTAFSDVPAGSFYEKAVLWAVANGITTGTDETHFSPDDVCTRAQVVTLLYRMKGAPVEGDTALEDVPDGAYYADAASWAASRGITTGTDAAHFSPDAPCTRAQIVTFIYRAFTE